MPASLGCEAGAATLWRDVQAVALGLAPDSQAALPPWVEVDRNLSAYRRCQKRPVNRGPGTQGRTAGTCA